MYVAIWDGIKLMNFENFFMCELVCCLILTGLIWTIQLVHYPSFLFVDKMRFSTFEKFHTNRICILVLPLMMLEATAGVYIWINSEINEPIFLWNVLGISLTWISTFVLSVPCHKKLGAGYDKTVIERLILTNWPRTILWTARSALLISIRTLK